MSSKSATMLPGLRAWEIQRRNRVRRAAVRVFGVVAVLAGGLLALPERWNPLIAVGLVTASDGPAARTARAEAVSAAVADRFARQSVQALPPLSTRPPTVLPDTTMAATEVACIAKAAFHEARGDNLEAMIAIGQVAINRSRSTGLSVCQVVHAAGVRGEACLFAATCKARATPETGQTWLLAKWVAEEVAAGRAWLRELNKSEAFHSYLVAPEWRFAQQRVRRIGLHVFYSPLGATADLSIMRQVKYRWDEVPDQATNLPVMEEMRSGHEVLAASQALPLQPRRAIVPRANPGATPANAVQPRTEAFNPFAGRDQR